MSLLNVLGTYYDSAVGQYTDIPTEICYTVIGEFQDFKFGNLSFAWSLKKPDSQQTVFIHVSSNFDITNTVVPNFHLSEVKEKTEYTLLINNSEITVPKNTPFMSMAFKQLDMIPKIFSFDVKVKREHNKQARIDYSKRNLNNKTPKEYFNAVCSGDMHNYGTIKNRILNCNKAIQIFLLEYLYGRKLPKNTLSLKCREELKMLPFNDFGINDVQKLKEFVNLLSKHRNCTLPAGVADSLYRFGLKPKTDLKRWKRQLVGTAFA